MPNTLAHLGVQALITRGLIARADLGWVWVGCILPDIPWIVQRGVTTLPLTVSAIDLRLWAVVQSALVFCLVAAAAVASIAPRSDRVFCIIALGCLLHLLLDATQTKWANGVLLFAPFDWRLLNLGLFWPENWPSDALSLIGLSYVSWALWRLGPGMMRPELPKPSRIATAIVLFALYLLGPLTMMPAAEAADTHYAGTLREVSARPGRTIEFDRADVRIGDDGFALLDVWTGETLELVGLPLPASAQEVSIRGRFLDDGRIEVTAFHVHAAGRRDMVAYFGLGVVVVWWYAMIYSGLRRPGPG